MTSMEQLYQQVILDHSRERHGEGTLERYDAESFQVNPTCGDEVRLWVRLDHDAAPRLVDLAWQGQGCSISQASLSVMTDLVAGRDVTQIDDTAEAFRELMHLRGAEPSEDLLDALGDGAAFTGVARFPARVKCGLLGWMALRDALAKALTSPPAT
ncbi:MAG TPA: SUF system NifU family Fe-S cluster assembly protein [Actinomycetaceae bacterium]|nr:SUF system NifU family Fe-S cluster assembly protein [Actinomycetaceae bacterium]